MAEPEASPGGGNPCPACNFVNAPNRLYCEDCGAKLTIAPPSYLATAPGAAPATTPASPAPKKPRILTARRESPFLKGLAVVARPAALLALIALVAALLWPPANLPPPTPAMDAATVADVRSRLAAMAQQGSTVDAPWERLNSYLASVLLPASGGGTLPTSFVRAVLLPRPGGFRFIVQKKSLGIPLYAEVDYRLVVRGGALALEATGAQIGRLPLPAGAAPLVETIAGRPGAALAPDLEVLQRARVVRLSPTGVHIGFAARRP